jgi:hypothetical protein
MKKLFIALTIVATAGFAQAKDSGKSMSGMNGRTGMDGCGLGWQVTEAPTLMGTATRGTTNAIIPPSFGMTSGTIGCEQLSVAQNEQESASFVATNYQTLKSELAVGHGEYVSAMIESFGCSSNQVPALSQKIQQNYQSVVAPTQNATELYKNLKNEIGQCS